jgi:hypothetical protein
MLRQVILRSRVRLGLVDEYRLQDFPCLADSRRSLLDDVAKPRHLGLASSTRSAMAWSPWSTCGTADGTFAADLPVMGGELLGPWRQ